MIKYGFELITDKNMREVGGTARLWRHRESGAELLSIANNDENKCFGVSFYTPPTDSTGVAHILEHSVLCGSAKYPLKEPFAELLKGSLQTFLNAFTFPDKTCYPVASANLQDFYNLIDVYLDAVFHPLLSRDTFAQEGWHIDAASADGPWNFKGVVYNEMKGVYSSPDSILAERSQQAVFPDNLYSLDSGGNPEHIPDLTYQAFRDFHQRYYQPGNARFFFWGDDPEEKRLERIAEAIKGYAKTGPLPQVKLQAQPAANRQIQVPYAAEKGETRTLMTCNWLLPEMGEISQALKMEMLEHILEGLPGSPLRRALMESGLGEDTTGCGLETDLRQMYYSTGLKGVAEANSARVEELILSTLESLANNGIDPAAVEAAVNTVEFAYRENNSGRFPRGLAAMILSLSTWLYGEDPIAPLAWESPLNQIKADLAAGKKVFEEAIHSYFLEQAHTRVTLLPDTTLAAVRAKTERNRLDEIQAQTGADKRQELVEATQALEEAQLKPDSPEDLAKIPSLGINDLPVKNAPIPTQIIKEGAATFISHALPTAGIAYAVLLLPITRIPRHLVPLLPLFTRTLTECGSGKRDYSQLGMAMAAKTGGINATIIKGAKLDSRQPYCYLSLAGKAVYDKIPALFDLFTEMLLDPPTNKQALLQRIEVMLLEARARLEHGLQAAGHSAVSLRLAAHFGGDGALAEQMTGISQLEYVRSLIKRLDKEADSVLADLRTLASLILGQQGAIVDIASETSALPELHNQASALLKRLPMDTSASTGEKISAWSPMTSLPAGEAFITQGQVNYVGKAANLYDLGYKYTGAANVILRWLRMGRLWEEVRVAGGAYGAFCTLERISGTFICASYRDPNVDRTLSAYDGLGAYLQNFNPTRAQLTQAIVGAVGALDTYLLPDARAIQALSWYLSGQTEELRQQMREEMLATTGQDFRNFASTLEAFAQNGDICVLGGNATAQAAKEHGWKERRIMDTTD